MAVGKWLHGAVADLAAWHVGVYYGVFLACVAWAFIVGAARASVHLLWLCAVVTLAVPASGLAGWLLPQWPPWLNTHPAALAVDATALVAAVLLLLTARRTARRVRHGEPAASVWAAGSHHGTTSGS
jgi:hypothetical protein